MTNKIRNVTKQLLGAEDVLFGRGTVNQRRGPADVSIHRLDLALPVADEAELAITDPEQYPKASIGSRNFVAVNGQYQEVSTIQPVLFSVGAMMSAEYPYAIDGDTVAKWTGAFPKTLTLADQGFTNPGWQVTSTGLGRAIISETVPSASFTREGVRWYKPSESTTYVYYCDGDSCQWVQESVQSAEGTLRSELATPDASLLVGGVEAGLSSRFVNGLKGLSPKADRPQIIKSIYVNGLYGGGTINYDPSANKVNHGKIKGDTLYIAPEAIAAWDGTSDGIDGLWGWTGAGTGCYTMQRNMFHALVFGADPTGVNENYKHFGWYAKSFDGNGGYGTINILPGFYKISNTIPNLKNSINIQGGGSSNTFLQARTTGDTYVLQSSGLAAGTNALTTYKGFALVSQIYDGRGINMQDSALCHYEDIYTEGFNIHWKLDSCLTSTFTKCISRFGPTNSIGLWAENSGTSNPNALTFLGCSFGPLGGLGLLFNNPSRITYLGGSIEACGSGTEAAVRINGAGGQGAAAFTFETYFEGNGGIADVWIVMLADSDPFTGVFRNCAFNRVNSSFATNNIRLTQVAGSKLAVIKVGEGCAFQKFGTYTPDAGRKYVLIDSASDNYRYIDDGSNYYSSEVEVPEVYPPPLTFGATVAVDYSKYSANSLMPLTILNASDFLILPPTSAPIGSIFRFFIRNVYGTPAGAMSFHPFYKLKSPVTAPILNYGMIIEFQSTLGGLYIETGRVEGIVLV